MEKLEIAAAISAASANGIAKEGAEPIESITYTLLDIAESLRRIANHLDRKDTPQ